MGKQVQVSLDQEVYDRLIQLQVVPYNSINDVIDHLQFHNGHKSKEVIDLEARGRHFSFEEEVERTKAGIYDTAGA